LRVIARSVLPLFYSSIALSQPLVLVWDISDAVDLFDSSTGNWSTAQLSVGRQFLAATSVGNTALFAGGSGSELFLILEGACHLANEKCVYTSWLLTESADFFFFCFALRAIAIS
jgi:hypothetical protein